MVCSQQRWAFGLGFPRMGGPRSGYWCPWRSFSVTLTPNYLDLGSTEKGTKQLSPLPEIRTRFPSPQDVCFLTTLLSHIPNSYLSSLIYIPLSMRSLRWKDIPYVSESLLSYHWLEGTHFLLWTWSPSKSNLMLVIAGQADSPNKLSLNHNMS